MSEQEKRPDPDNYRDRKSESPEDRKKSEVGSSKSEEENKSAPDSYRDDIPNSEIKNKSDIEHPTSEINSLPTANSKLQTETMEVHHHPEVEKKGFKEYLLEGLMIFIAVMMGFFAESLRENIADRSKEKEYIISMIQDAKTDTANIQKAIKLNKRRILALDSAANLCYDYNGPGASDREIYRQFAKSIYYPDFAYLTERTLSQLKNAGGMRLIRKKKAVDSIVLYDNYSKKLVNQQEAYGTYLGGLVELSFKMFNYKYFFYHQKAVAGYKLPDNKSVKLIDLNKATIIELANRTEVFAGVVGAYVGRLNEANGHAVNMINTLKKEYNLEDE